MTSAPVTTAHLEAALEQFFRRRIRLLGGHTIKLAPTERGVPDRLVLLPGGRMYLVELKAEGGHLSPSQQVWHQRATALGTDVVTLHGQPEVVEWLRKVTDEYAVLLRRSGHRAAAARRKAARS